MNPEGKIKKIEELQAADKTYQVLSEILLYTDDKDFRVKLSAAEALSAFNCYPKAKNKLIQLTNSFSSEERMYALEQLGEFSGEDVGETVLSKLQDPDSLVRISAVEVLGVIEYKKAIPALCHSLSDPDEVMRSYTARTLGELGDKELVPILKEKLKTEHRNRARLGFYVGLYFLGEVHYLSNIIDLLKCRSYRVRCSAANSLVGIADPENVTLIRENLKKVLLKEKTIAAESSILGALEELDSIFGQG